MAQSPMQVIQKQDYFAVFVESSRDSPADIFPRTLLDHLFFLMSIQYDVLDLSLFVSFSREIPPRSRLADAFTRSLGTGRCI